MTNLILPERFKLALPDSVILKPRQRNGNIGNLSLRGEYRFIVRDGATGQVTRETDWVPNLFTNYGLDTEGAGNVPAGYCRIGTGNTAPANSDTQLVSQSASTSSVITSTNTNAGAPNYETLWTVTYQFALGAVVGNMAEIGVGTAASGATLSSRALIVDGVGAPTTITVLITEILQVVYRFTVFPNLVDATGTVTIGGVGYNYVSRTYQAASVLNVRPDALSFFGSVFSPFAYPSTSTLGSVTSAGPSGSPAGFTNGTLSAYVNGNYYRDLTLNAGIADGNASGGIAAIKFSVGAGGAVFQNQISFDKTAGGGPIPKDGTKALAITLRQPFSRH